MKRKKRRVSHVNPYLRLRNEKGRFNRDFQDLVKNPSCFKENCRVNPQQFNELLMMIQDEISPSTRSRQGRIFAAEMLAVTLEYLASGTVERQIASCYRISKQKIGTIIMKTCQALTKILNEKYQINYTKETCLLISNEYNVKWNFPNCIGAVDGKHCAMRCPRNGGSLFYNYKGFHGIVLMAVADAN